MRVASPVASTAKSGRSTRSSARPPKTSVSALERGFDSRGAAAGEVPGPWLVTGLLHADVDLRPRRVVVVDGERRLPQRLAGDDDRRALWLAVDRENDGRRPLQLLRQQGEELRPRDPRRPADEEEEDRRHERPPRNPNG